MALSYPLRVEGHLDAGMSRWLWLVKWVLAIPHYVVLAFLWAGFVVTSVLAFFAILFTGRYPRGLFDFNVGVLRWTWRVGYYSCTALGTDRYPPFTLSDVADYPARLDVAYPEHLSRGLVLIKWWLLAVPHYLITGLFLGGGAWFVGRYDSQATDAGAGGLIGLLVLIAAIALLFTGTYPRSIFDIVLGLDRWVLRVAAYAGLMTDQYPPFRLDLGGTESGTLAVMGGSAPTAWSGTGGSPAPATGPGPMPGTTQRAPGWSASSVVAMVVGSLVVLLSLVVLAGGGAALVVDQGHRDTAGYVRSDPQRLSTDAAAISSADAQLLIDGPGSSVVDRVLGDTSLRVSSASGSGVFAGIAQRSDVDSYLAGFGSAEVTRLGRGGPTYALHGVGAPTSSPADSDIWVTSVQGLGTQTLSWRPDQGDWVLVVMNADGAPGVDVTVDLGAELPALTAVSAALLGTGGVLLVGGVLMIWATARSRQDKQGGAGPTTSTETS